MTTLPKQIDHYMIHDVLGEGGFGTVYRATDTKYDREVALKVLPRSHSRVPKIKKRFQREIRIIRSLDHPAIVPVHDDGEYHGRLYYAMRLMPFGSLANRIERDQKLTLDATFSIVNRVAAALAKAHSKGIVHRDVKPDNILFDELGDPSVSDFGIAKVMASEGLTGPNTVVGSLHYLSPEQAQGKEVDGQSDIYSLGATLFHMLTGRYPYSGEPEILISQHKYSPVPRLSEFCPELPADLQILLELMMSKSKAERLASVSEVPSLLAGIIRGESLPKNISERITKGKTPSVSGFANNIDVIFKSLKQIVTEDGENNFVIFECKSGPECYLQFMADQSDMSMYGEAVSNFYLSSIKIEEKKFSRLLAMGWNAPLKGEIENYHREWANADHDTVIFRIAQEVMDVFVNVYDCPPDVEIDVSINRGG